MQLMIDFRINFIINYEKTRNLYRRMKKLMHSKLSSKSKGKQSRLRGRLQLKIKLTILDMRLNLIILRMKKMLLNLIIVDILYLIEQKTNQQMMLYLINQIKVICSKSFKKKCKQKIEKKYRNKQKLRGDSFLVQLNLFRKQKLRISIRINNNKKIKKKQKRNNRRNLKKIKMLNWNSFHLINQSKFIMNLLKQMKMHPKL
ncbi:unnamed protein product [Paramecium primaurelia]|uniref:Uncharacterized protein n=1 Tax=Paramecium primaurelia TaxID=5886 RepID=A0A8S1NHW1_PARPR|nr:unnamed protein product [Paramecium primaurelia]